VNTYSGSTVVSAGSLLVSGSLNGATKAAVAAGATLGVGEAAGAGSFETQTLNTLNLTLGTTGLSTSQSAITLTLGTSGSADSIFVTNGFTLGGAGTLNLVLNSGASLSGASYQLLSWGSGLGVNASEIDYSNSSAAVLSAVASSSYSFQVVGNNLDLVAAVPEPSIWALLGIGLAAVMIQRVRRIPS
jgi:hypothetical protein